MPHPPSHPWTRNKLVIAGPPHELARFRRLFEKSRLFLDFGAVYPESPYSFSFREVLTWREKHWGWSGVLYLRLPQPGDTELAYSFVTRPGPPIGWLKGAARLFPELEFALTHTTGQASQTEVILPATRRLALAA